MSRFVEGEDRRQPALLPSCLEDYVSEDNPARVIAWGNRGHDTYPQSPCWAAAGGAPGSVNVRQGAEAEVTPTVPRDATPP